MNNANLWLLSLGFVSTTALAGAMGMTLPDASMRPLMTVNLGPVWSNNGTTQTLLLKPGIEKTYAAAKKTEALGYGEVFIGWQRPLYASIFGQLGLALAVSSNAKLSGNVWENANPNFNAFSYQYKVNYSVLALKGKLLTNSIYGVQPYLSGGLGVSMNRAHDFTLKSKQVQKLPRFVFTPHTTTGFSYTLGLGLQAAITSHWQVGLGYEFADRGKFNLTRATNQTLGTGLELNHLYVHQLQLSLSYLA